MGASRPAAFPSFYSCRLDGTFRPRIKGVLRLCLRRAGTPDVGGLPSWSASSPFRRFRGRLKVARILRFEERNLKPYAEPMSASDLKEGEIYFFLNFVDEDMLVPAFTTGVFIGRNLEAGDIDLVYFQDVRSYRQGVRYDWDSDEEREGIFFHGSETETGHVFEYERALDGLLACLLRRSAHRARPAMRFEARELRPDPEPVLPSELTEGKVYFFLGYVDDEKLNPVVETVVYRGKFPDADGHPKLSFQDIDSYHEGIRLDTPADENYATFCARSPDTLSDIFDYDRALEELMRCSLRRRGLDNG